MGTAAEDGKYMYVLSVCDLLAVNLHLIDKSVEQSLVERFDKLVFPAFECHTADLQLALVPQESVQGQQESVRLSAVEHSLLSIPAVESAE